ncbi:MAG: hypothetical protein H5U37_04685 [Caldisericia bacterium]|nr:hypothetical protein [Caldisericia bacterium]
MKRKIIILLIVLFILLISYFLWDYFRVIRKNFITFEDVKYMEINKNRNRIFITLSNGKKLIVEYTCCYNITPVFLTKDKKEQQYEIKSKPANDIKFIDSKVVIYYKDGDYEIHDLEKEIMNIFISKIS